MRYFTRGERVVISAVEKRFSTNHTKHMEGGDDSRSTDPGGFKETTPPLFFPPMNARALEWELL
jgi:hypothetical protein